MFRRAGHHSEQTPTHQNIMKTLKILALALGVLASAVSAKADWVSGYFRNNGTYVAPYYRSPSLGSRSCSPTPMPYYGSSMSSRGYVYRNPYAAEPSVSVHGYFRSNGTYVQPYVRTAPNGILEDNLSYRGFGTVRVPKSSPW
jgi:hypothetical protein